MAGGWRKISECGYSCAKLAGSSGNFHSKQVRVLNMWVSGYCQTVEYPRSIDQKASIPLQQY